MLHVTDLLRCPSSEEWYDHIPLLLHIAVLGLDSLRPPICRHSRQVIINIILLQVGEVAPASQLSNILLTNQVHIIVYIIQLQCLFKSFSSKSRLSKILFF